MEEQCRPRGTDASDAGYDADCEAAADARRRAGESREGLPAVGRPLGAGSKRRTPSDSSVGPDESESAADTMDALSERLAGGVLLGRRRLR